MSTSIFYLSYGLGVASFEIIRILRVTNILIFKGFMSVIGFDCIVLLQRYKYYSN